MAVTPVTLPPGWLRLATRPSSTGFAPIWKTIGTSDVAAFAAPKFRQAIQQALVDADYQRAMAAEMAAGGRAGQEFEQRNPDFAKDERTKRAVIAECMAIQREDVQKAFDLAGWEKRNGRRATESEVVNLHLQLRALHTPGLRTCDQLLDDAAEAFERWSGRKRASTIPDPSAEILARRNRIRALRGDPLEEAQPRRSSDSDQPDQHDMSGLSPAEITARFSGADAESPGVIADRRYGTSTGREDRASDGGGRDAGSAS
jgi:hypothetical protein